MNQDETKTGTKTGDDFVQENGTEQKKFDFKESVNMKIQEASDLNDTTKRAKNGPVEVVKLCSLYKPLLRRFRGFFKQYFEKEIAKHSTSQHWDKDCLYSHFRKFMRVKLRVPECLLTDECVF